MKDGKDYVRGRMADRGAASVIALANRARVEQALDPIPEPASPEPTGPVVMARLDHGRWIGDCGLADTARQRVCRNAQFVDPDDHRFYCVVCHNAACGGVWRPVLWPIDRAQVEAPLAGLPAREQNWTPP
jgi:hypothetical protein